MKQLSLFCKLMLFTGSIIVSAAFIPARETRAPGQHIKPATIQTSTHSRDFCYSPYPNYTISLTYDDNPGSSTPPTGSIYGTYSGVDFQVSSQSVTDAGAGRINFFFTGQIYINGSYSGSFTIEGYFTHDFLSQSWQVTRCGL